MTEREKMVAGMLYDSADQELQDLRERCVHLCKKFNDLSELRAAEQKEVLKELLGSVGEHLWIRPPLRLDYGCNVYLGNVSINFNCTMLDVAPIHIGDNVQIGPNVSFFTASHPLLAKERNAQFDETGRRYTLEYGKPITVEDNVWIGGGTIINGGVTIGHDAVIGAGSVVTKDIPAGVVAAGVPCRVIRPLTKNDAMFGKSPNEDIAPIE
ncbi:MAG: sugar O-acetyltransferase [Oscillospiraceae bacterium]|nr:sugar O-acetyltransferase [Oscillospiraceae bacterium]